MTTEKIRAALQNDKPGWQAQVLMTPDPYRLKKPPVHKQESCRRSAVMVLLVQDEETATVQVTLTVRSKALKHHAGQVSFPGGGIDPGETVVEAALRESQEEVGINPADVEILGELTHLYIPVSNNLMFPIVGCVNSDVTFYPDPREVHEVFTVPVSTLFDRTIVQQKDWTIQGKATSFPYWNIHGEVPVWGATAMILSELVELIRP